MTTDENPDDREVLDLEEAHRLADPEKGDQSRAGRANVTPVDQGSGVSEADKKL